MYKSLHQTPDESTAAAPPCPWMVLCVELGTKTRLRLPVVRWGQRAAGAGNEPSQRQFYSALLAERAYYAYTIKTLVCNDHNQQEAF